MVWQPWRYARSVPVLAVVLSLSLLLPGPAAARDPRLKVVATVAPLADLVRQIAGPRIDLVQIIPDGTRSEERRVGKECRL